MPCVRWNGISEGLATGDSRPQDLPASLQAVSWQGPNNIGLTGEPGLSRRRSQRHHAKGSTHDDRNTHSDHRQRRIQIIAWLIIVLRYGNYDTMMICPICEVHSAQTTPVVPDCLAVLSAVSGIALSKTREQWVELGARVHGRSGCSFPSASGSALMQKRSSRRIRGG
jgi:hypothetical protein